MALHPFRLAAHHLGPARPIMRGGDQLHVARAVGDVAEGVGGALAIALAPGGQAFRPGALDRPVAAAGSGQSGEAPGVAVVADDVIGPGDALLIFGARVRPEQRLPLDIDRLGLVGPIVLDQRLDQGLELGRGRIAFGRFGPRARRGWLPTQTSFSVAGSAGRSAAPRVEASRASCSALGISGARWTRARSSGELDLRRSLGEDRARRARHCGAGRPRMAASLVEAPSPVARPDRREDLAIALPLLRAEVGRDRFAGPGAVLGESGGRRQGERRGQQEGAETGHSFTSSISIWRSAQAMRLQARRLQQLSGSNGDQGFDGPGMGGDLMPAAPRLRHRQPEQGLGAGVAEQQYRPGRGEPDMVAGKGGAALHRLAVELPGRRADAGQSGEIDGVAVAADGGEHPVEQPSRLAADQGPRRAILAARHVGQDHQPGGRIAGRADPRRGRGGEGEPVARRRARPGTGRAGRAGSLRALPRRRESLAALPGTWGEASRAAPRRRACRHPLRPTSSARFRPPPA